MKTFLSIAFCLTVLCACSSKEPPQPYGTSFPINSVVIQGGK